MKLNGPRKAMKSKRRLFDVPEYWYEDHEHVPFYQEDKNLTPTEFKQSVSHWRKAAQEMSRAEIVQLLEENRDENLPICIALRPILDRRDQADRRALMNSERKEAWNNVTDRQREAMIKRRMKNKHAVDHIKNRQRFLNTLK